MGFLDKMKAAGQAVTGGSARVSIEFGIKQLKPGDALPVKVTVISMGREVKSSGVFVDIHAEETGSIRCKHCGQVTPIKNETIKQAIPVGPAMVLQPNETKVFEATINIPMGAAPTYNGAVRHEWKIRGRLEAFGNDPDSGFQSIEIR